MCVYIYIYTYIQDSASNRTPSPPRPAAWHADPKHCAAHRRGLRLPLRLDPEGRKEVRRSGRAAHARGN